MPDARARTRCGAKLTPEVVAMLRKVLAVIVGTLAAFVAGMLYDYICSWAADAARGSAVEVWFSPGNTQYLMPWLFAIAGLISTIIAVIMAGERRGTEHVAHATSAAAVAKTQPEKAKPKGKQASAATEVPGIPGFDFDQAKAEIKSAPSASAKGDAPPAPSGSRPMLAETLPAALDEPSPDPHGAMADPPKEPQP
jgi:hypothetical protein